MKGLSKAEGGVVLELWVQPGSKKTEIVGFYGDFIKIKLNAPPVDGKANKECLRYIADTLFVKRSAVVMISGEKDRHKKVLIKGMTPEIVQELLVVTD